jgi:hypothetical protein
MGEKCIRTIENLRGLFADLPTNSKDMGVNGRVPEDARGREAVEGGGLYRFGYGLLPGDRGR